MKHCCSYLNPLPTPLLHLPPSPSFFLTPFSTLFEHKSTVRLLMHGPIATHLSLTPASTPTPHHTPSSLAQCKSEIWEQGGQALAICELKALLKVVEVTHENLSKELCLDSWTDIWEDLDDRASLRDYSSNVASATSQVSSQPNNVELTFIM